MQKILFITPLRSARIYPDMLNNIPKKDIEIHFLGYDNYQFHKFDDEIKTHGLAENKIGISPFKGYYKKLKEINPDKIMVMDIYGRTFWSALLYKVFMDLDYELILYSEAHHFSIFRFKRMVQKFIVRFVFAFFKRYINKILCFNDKGKDFYEGYYDGPIEVCPVGINTNLFHFFIDENVAKAKYPIKFLMVARFQKRKDHKVLFKALNYFQKNYDKEFQLSLIGLSGDKKRVLKLIDENNLGDKVNLLDKVPFEKMQSVYHDHDIALLTSYREAIGMTVPEAMACGLPTITSSHVGANTYVREGETGYIYKVRDHIDLAEKTYKLINQDYKKMGKQASELIKKEYNLSVVGKDIYKSLME